MFALFWPMEFAPVRCSACNEVVPVRDAVPIEATEERAPGRGARCILAGWQCTSCARRAVAA